MKMNAKQLLGYHIHATDGDIGKVDDLFFDDEKWVVRYLVINTGSWLKRHRVLISPVSIERIEWRAAAVAVNLSQAEVENSPDIVTDQPVSRQEEARMFSYYGYRPYWWGGELWGVGMYPAALAPVLGAQALASREHESTREREAAEQTVAERGDPHLRSILEVSGYDIEAADGRLGHVEDFLMDENTYELTHLVVDTRNWLPGKSVLVSPAQVTKVEWPGRRVSVALTREAIRNQPRFDPRSVEGEPLASSR